jgi:GntR family transcriptional regulator
MSMTGDGSAEHAAIPLYRRVAHELRGEIEERMEPGEAIATETALGLRFGVSRITIRRAIDLLEQAGLVHRRQGSGTYVRPRRVVEELGAIHSWTDDMRGQGLEPRTVHADLLVVSAPAWVATALRLGADDQSVLRLERLRYANEEPISVMVDFLRLDFVPGLAREGLCDESLYLTLASRYHLDLDRAEDTVTAREASFIEASLLRLKIHSPVLQVKRVTYLPDNIPLGAATAVTNAARYAYHVTGRPRRATGRAYGPGGEI